MGGCSFDWSATSKGSRGVGSLGHLVTHLGQFLQSCDTFGPNSRHLERHLGPIFVKWPSSCCKANIVKMGSIWERDKVCKKYQGSFLVQLVSKEYKTVWKAFSLVTERETVKTDILEHLNLSELQHWWLWLIMINWYPWWKDSRRKPSWSKKRCSPKQSDRDDHRKCVKACLTE